MIILLQLATLQVFFTLRLQNKLGCLDRPQAASAHSALASLAFLQARSGHCASVLAVPLPEKPRCRLAGPPCLPSEASSTVTPLRNLPFWLLLPGVYSACQLHQIRSSLRACFCSSVRAWWSAWQAVCAVYGQ